MVQSRFDRPLWTVKDVADYLGVHASTIYRLLKEEAIPAFKIHSDWRFDRDEIIAWVKAQPRGWKP